MKKILIISLAILFASCSGSKAKVKPEQTEIAPKDTSLTTLTEPKKLFSDNPPETTIDTVIIPKRTKPEKEKPQIIVAPIVLPITTAPILQTPEQITTEPRGKEPTLKIEAKPEQVEEEIKKEPEVKKEKESEPIVEAKLDLQYFIQIGAFVTENSANQHLKTFKKLYPDKDAFVVFDSSDGLYKVRIGGLKDSTRLAQILPEIQLNFTDAFITTNAPKLKLITEKTPFIKLQVGAYTKASEATKIKEYLESTFNVKSDIVESGGLFKVIALLSEDDHDTLNKIKAEFQDAFIIK